MASGIVGIPPGFAGCDVGGIPGMKAGFAEAGGLPGFVGEADSAVVCDFAGAASGIEGEPGFVGCDVGGIVGAPGDFAVASGIEGIPPGFVGEAGSAVAGA